VAENKNIGNIASVTHSKSCQLRMNVVQAMPQAANANASSNANGKHSNAHHECSKPIAVITTRNAVE